MDTGYLTTDESGAARITWGDSNLTSASAKTAANNDILGRQSIVEIVIQDPSVGDEVDFILALSSGTESTLDAACGTKTAAAITDDCAHAAELARSCVEAEPIDTCVHNLSQSNDCQIKAGSESPSLIDTVVSVRKGLIGDDCAGGVVKSGAKGIGEGDSG